MESIKKDAYEHLQDLQAVIRFSKIGMGEGGWEEPPSLSSRREPLFFSLFVYFLSESIDPSVDLIGRHM